LRAADVRAFIRRCFVPANAVLALVGGIPWRHVRQTVGTAFAGTDGRPAPVAPLVLPGGQGTLRLRRLAGAEAHVTKMMAVPAKPREIIAMGVALDLVGSDPDSRLFQEVRERLGLGYDVSAALDWGPDWAVAMISVSAARGQLERLRRTMDETCQRAAVGGFDEGELRRARKKIRYRYASAASSRLNQALSLGEGVLTGFPTPAQAERIAAELDAAEIAAAWRRAVNGRTLNVVLAS
jgi:zinc protease